MHKRGHKNQFIILNEYYMQEKKAYKLLLQSIILRTTTDVYNTYVSESKLVAAVTASSSPLILRGTFLHPGDFRIFCNWLTVFSNTYRLHLSILVTTTKTGTFKANVNPKCSLVVPAAKDWFIKSLHLLDFRLFVYQHNYILSIDMYRTKRNNYIENNLFVCQYLVI